MRYSIESGDKTYVKIYGFLSFAKNSGTHATKFAKNMSNKYSQKPRDSAKKSTTDVIKTASKRVIQKTTEETGDSIGDKVPDRITRLSRKSSQNDEANYEMEIPKERYISPEKGRQIIHELRLV